MKKSIKNLPEIAIGAALAVSFWQTRYFLMVGHINGGYSEYMTLSLYASQIVWLIAGLIFVLCRRSGPEIRFDWRLSLFLIAFFWPVLTLIWAPMPFVGLFLYLALVMGLIAACLLIYARAAWDKIFVWALVPSATLGLWQFFTQSAFAFKYLGLAEKVAGALNGESVIETATGRWLRAYGSFDHPNIFGGVLVIGFILVVNLLLSKQAKLWERRAYYAIAILFSLGIFFSFSRAAWLAAGLSFLILGIAVWKSESKRHWLLLALLLIIFNGGILLQYRELWTVRFDPAVRLETKSLSDRVRYGLEANQLIKTHWLIGVGWGQYIPALVKTTPDYRNRPAWDYQPVHDIIRLLWAEIGLIGLVLAAGAIAWFWCRFSPAETAILISLGLFALTDHWLMSLPFGLLFCGLTLGLIFKKS